MSQLFQARQRIMMKGNIIEKQEEHFCDHPNYSAIQVSVKELDGLSRMSPDSRQADFSPGLKKHNSPFFAKSDRLAAILEPDKIDSLSERHDQIGLFNNDPGTRVRRMTTYARNSRPLQSRQPTITDFTEKQSSLYQDAGGGLGDTVHKQKLSLIISLELPRQALSPNKPKECTKYEYDEVMKYQRQNNQNFTDQMFPPRFGIIYNKKYMYVEEGIKFERIPRIYDSLKVSLIKNCEPAHLEPGTYTSEAVFDSLAILAEEPSYILSVLGNQQINYQGVYYLRLCKDGVWRYILVDDYIPIKVTSPKPMANTLHSVPVKQNVEVWPCLVEKALAKMYGTYQDLYLTANRGVKSLLRNLTGMPAVQHMISKDFRSFLVMVDTAIKKKQIVVLEELKEEYMNAAEAKRIQAMHAYKILEVKKNNIVIRNYNEKQLKTKLNLEEVMMFSRLIILRAEKGYAYTSYTLRHRQSYFSSLHLHIHDKNGVKGYWDVWQNSQVYYKNHIGSKIDYHCAPCFITMQEFRQSYQSDQSERYRDQTDVPVGKEIEIKQGEYLVKFHLCQAAEQIFTVSFYGEKPVDLKRIKLNQKWDRQGCMCQPKMNSESAFQS